MSCAPSPVSDSPAEKTREAGPPFHDIIPDHTVVLRSSDDVNFFVLKSILAQVSVVFKDMFDLPKAEISSPLEFDNQRHGLPVIQVTEASSTLDIILRFCYPVENPDLTNLEDIRLLLEARRKYMIEAFDRSIKDELARVAESQPFAVFALASRYALEDVANDAAKRMLCFPQADVLDESALKDITAAQYHRLLQYRRDCVLRATTEPQIMWFNALSSSYPPTPITSVSCRTQFHFFFVSSPPRSLWVPHWWTTYLHKALQLLKDRPRGDTVTSPDLLEYFFDCTGFCSDCQQEGKAALSKFSTALAQEVEKAIAQARAMNCLTRTSLLTRIGRFGSHIVNLEPVEPAEGFTKE
jgi:BTB/POZ domain